MSLYDYRASQRLAIFDVPFHALLMAALRQADSANAAKIRGTWPDVAAEFQARYDAPGGFLDGEEAVDAVTTEAAPEPVTHELVRLAPDRVNPHLVSWVCSCDEAAVLPDREPRARRWHAEHAAKAQEG